MRIKAPPMSESEFYNYKEFFSVVLLAVDAHYKFTWVDIGQYGSISDGGVWSNSDFGQALDHGEVDLPLDKPLPGTDVVFPHFLVGDEAFPLKKYLMRPFPGRMHQVLPDEQRIFNYRLARARRVSENAFGILTMWWQVLNSLLVCSVEKGEDIIKALVCLHMLMDNEANDYINPVQLELELQDGNIQSGAWTNTQVTENYFQRLGKVGANRAASIVNGMRQHLAEYLASDIGTTQAPWQFERAFRGTRLNLPQ
ncbi:uncharacterized protein LOC116849887 [Odontomachus brunneus]|uniref:uncharacterized protein LOC116849887 n=1 Tax=Odontomachus brunneus TaxID=486640 RepID=UPI0013F195E9|nr:uncharacterized protein LOC116849887 [Odontomachus brunneus]